MDTDVYIFDLKDVDSSPFRMEYNNDDDDDKDNRIIMFMESGDRLVFRRYNDFD